MKISVVALAIVGPLINAPEAGEFRPCRGFLINSWLWPSQINNLLTDAAGEVQQNKDMFHYMRDGMLSGSNMWIFGDSGLNIYSADGNKHYRSTPAAEICHNTTGWASSCPFFHFQPV